MEKGPHSGDSQSRFGFNSLSQQAAWKYPDSRERSKSSIVHNSALSPELLAVCVMVEEGEQNTSNRSSCSSVLCINIAMSLFRSLCHCRFSFAIHLPLAGGSGSVGSGAALYPLPLSSHCSLPDLQ